MSDNSNSTYPSNTDLSASLSTLRVSGDEYSAPYTSTSEQNDIEQNAFDLPDAPYTSEHPLTQHPALSRYSELKKIGAGSQGTMLRACTADGTQIAIKVFDIQKADSLKSLELFEREIDTLKNINVPGVPKFIEDIRTDRYLYLVEEYINAPSLEKRMQTGQRFTFEQVLTILKNAAQILQDLGDLIPPVVHRDIKPANLLVDDACHVALVDFGVVAAKDQSSFAMTFAGTAGYLAPEQLYGKATTASDIFSLGVTIAQLVTGKAPCDMNMDGLKLNIHKYIPSNIPKWFVHVLDQMIAPNASDRLQNGRQVLDRLRSASQTADFQTTTQTTRETPHIAAPSDAQNQDTPPADASQSADNSTPNSADAPANTPQEEILQNNISETYRSMSAEIQNFYFFIFGTPLVLALLSLPIFGLLKVIFNVPGSDCLTHWLPGIYPILVGLSGVAVLGCCISDEKYEDNVKTYKKDAIALNKMYAQKLINPESPIGNLPNFNEILDIQKTGMIDNEVLMPLTPDENAQLDRYIKFSLKPYPCLAFKPHTTKKYLSYIPGVLLCLIINSAILTLITRSSELPFTWTVISIIVYALSTLSYLKYFKYIFTSFYKRISDPEYIQAYQLYLRHFLYEYQSPEFTANPDDPQTQPTEQTTAPHP